MALPSIGTFQSEHSKAILNPTMVIGASLLLVLSAKTQVPFYPVPMTMQTAAVFGIILALGPQRAVLAVLFYLLEGLAGLPVFAGSAERGVGLVYLAGPTGGYLMGCLPAALLSGKLAARNASNSLVTTFTALLLALAIIYGSGLVWLGATIGFDKPLLRLGFLPFIAGDLLKVSIVALAFWRARQWSKGQRKADV
jgi:biotin transport system substrate-specific component